MSNRAVAPPSRIAHEGTAVAARGIHGWWRSPWRRPILLAALTWGSLVWSIVPVLIAVFLSFNGGRSNTTFQGPFSFSWWYGAPQGDPQGSLFTDPELRSAIRQTYLLSAATVLVAVPLGVSFAIGLDRWRGRVAAASNFLMLLSFVLPEIILGVAMLLVVQFLLKFVLLGTQAQLLGLITFQISYPVIVVRARLLSIPKEYEEAGMDLGASATQAIRRVLLPMLIPAIFASCALVFADTVDDFVTVAYLSGPASSQPLSVKIYRAARGAPTPAVNAAATLMLVSTTLVIAFGYIAYRRISRGQRVGVTDFAQI